MIKEGSGGANRAGVLMGTGKAGGLTGVGRAGGLWGSDRALSLTGDGMGQPGEELRQCWQGKELDWGQQGKEPKRCRQDNKTQKHVAT